ncbi:MAG: helix-turn-helix domain-containing protein [Aquificota bacterium]|nr:helix-turn-helix domain-containing protein [Aquificota bacterium]
MYIIKYPFRLMEVPSMELNLLSCKWALRIVLELLDSPRRPSELKRVIKGIEERVLFDRLRRLLRAGLIRKEEAQGYPKKTIYYLVDPEYIRPIALWIKDTGIPVDEAVSLVSCRWTLEVLRVLREERTPKEIKATLRGISDKVLHSRLYSLETMGLVSRYVIPTRPVKVVYSLTDRGAKILPALEKLGSFILYSGKRRSPCPSPGRGRKSSPLPCP